MKKRKVNIYSLILAGVLVLGTLSACSNSSAPAASNTPASEAPASQTPASEAPSTPASEAPASEAPAPAAEGASGKIVVATENETPSLTVAEHNAVAGSYMNSITHNGLFRTDAATLEPVPDLVESYQALNDLEWEFTLKENVIFHNGDVMTADDVVASLEYVKQFPDCRMYQQRIAKVEKVDDLTIKITTEEPTAMLLTDLAHHGNFIMPKSLIDSGNDFNTNPIGTGPFLFKNWTFGDSVEFEAFDNYFEEERAAKIQEMVWRIIPEGSSRTIALEAGEVDFIVEVATQDIPRMQDNDNITVYLGPGTSHNFLMLNNELPMFSNIAVRKALDMAIDKEAVVAVALDDLANPTYVQVPTGFAGVSEEGVNNYDPDAALALLQAEGVDPSSITFDIICSNDQKRRCGEVIQGNLAEIGINVTLSSMDLATYLDVTQTGDYQTAIGGYTSSDLLSYLNGVWHSNSINASNKTRTSVPEIDALIDQASAETDASAREAILLECTKLINETCGQVPIYQDTVKRAFNSKIVAPELSASGNLNLGMVYWAE